MKAMVADTASRRGLRPRTTLLLGCIGLILLLSLAVGIAWLRSARALDAELARIRAAGEPTSAEELEAFYQSPPAGLDATQLWFVALAPLETQEYAARSKDLPIVGFGEDAIPPPGEPWPQLEAAEQLLTDYREPLERMRRAAESGGQARFPTRFADGHAAGFSHYGQLREGARLLHLQSEVATYRKRPDVATESIVTALAVGHSLQREPTLISQLMHIALRGITLDRLEHVLSALALDDSQLQRLDAAVAASEFRLAMRRGIVGERVLGNAEFSKEHGVIRKMNGDVRPGWTPIADQTLYLRLMGELIAAADKPRAAREQAIDALQARLEQLEAAASAKLLYPFAISLAPRHVSGQLNAADRAEAQRDMARLAVAVERSYLRHGKLPQRLDELVPEFMDRVPIDPFDGAPLRYRADAKEYVVYSVGTDGIDQGGPVKPPRGLPVDWVFRVRRKDAGSTPAEPQP